VAFQYLKGACRKDEEVLVIRECGDRTRGIGFKLKESRFRLEIRKRFFTVRVVRYSNRLPRQVVDSGVHAHTGWCFEQHDLMGGYLCP